jgi:hypothetical protein
MSTGDPRRVFELGGRPRRRFAALQYFGTGNLGDEIQTLAAIGHLPTLDALVDRERLDDFRPSERHRIILNGWFMHRTEHWPPSDRIDPLPVSMHLSGEVMRYSVLREVPNEVMLKGAGREWLVRHGPVGARDLYTLDRLAAAGIDAWFSGCLTLTLQRPGVAGPRRGVYAVDVPEDVCASIERQHRLSLWRRTHLDDEPDSAVRFAKAAALLDEYASAAAVVTTRLHCALPCLALGTPVCFIEHARDRYRFEGLRELLHATTLDEVRARYLDFDLRNPPANLEGWRPLAEALRATCSRFVAGDDAPPARASPPALRVA